MIDRSTAKVQRGPGKFAAAVLLLLWLVTTAVAASPLLHERLHDDAQKTGHTCVVSLMQEQSILAGTPPVVVPQKPLQICETRAFRYFHHVQTADFSLSPSRAPPSLLPLSTVADWMLG